MVSVAEVQSGLACDCYCPACGEPLIARKGLKNVHHFAHHSDADCASAFETSVHLMAKQIIAQEKRLTTPQLTLRERDTDSDGFPTWQELTIPEANVRCSSVDTEKEVSNLKIDAVGRNHRGAELLIEFFVTHEVPGDKKEKIRVLGKSAIEIDLSDVSYSITEAKLKDLIVESTKTKDGFLEQATTVTEKNYWPKKNLKKRFGLSVKGYSSYAPNIATCIHNVCAWELHMLGQMFDRPRA